MELPSAVYQRIAEFTTHGRNAEALSSVSRTARAAVPASLRTPRYGVQAMRRSLEAPKLDVIWFLASTTAEIDYGDFPNRDPVLDSLELYQSQYLRWELLRAQDAAHVLALTVGQRHDLIAKFMRLLHVFQFPTEGTRRSSRHHAPASFHWYDMSRALRRGGQAQVNRLVGQMLRNTRFMRRCQAIVYPFVRKIVTILRASGLQVPMPRTREEAVVVARTINDLPATRPADWEDVVNRFSRACLVTFEMPIVLNRIRAFDMALNV